MAILIRAAAESRVEVHPQNGTSFTLEELQGFVGGYVEPLRLSDGSIMVLNEDGKSLGLRVNVIADLIAHHLTLIAESDYIVGDVVITSLTEWGEEEPEAA